MMSIEEIQKTEKRIIAMGCSSFCLAGVLDKRQYGGSMIFKQ